MSLEKAQAHLQKHNLQHNIKKLDTSSATVALAAQALKCEEARIAKTLSFVIDNDCILIVAAGDAKIDNSLYKAEFGAKATMLPHEQVEPLTGHEVGGVCPFGVNPNVEIYLDESLKRFDIIYPACGSSSSAVKLTIAQLEEACESARWINVCKGWQ